MSAVRALSGQLACCPRTARSCRALRTKWLGYAALEIAEDWHGVCHIPGESFLTQSRRTIMKFETLMLKSFFAASLLVCVLTFGAMITAQTNAPGAVATQVPVVAVANSQG